jgi:hypothetical protein
MKRPRQRGDQDVPDVRKREPGFPLLGDVQIIIDEGNRLPSEFIANKAHEMGLRIPAVPADLGEN